MNDIVARLRESVRACRALDRSALLEEAATMIERLRMTPAEREAIDNVLHHIATRADHLQREAHDLRGLLERMK